jgi:CRP-like cAMP-binding protein
MTSTLSLGALSYIQISDAALWLCEPATAPRVMARTITANQNDLLAALPKAEAKRFAPHLIPVELGVGEVIYDSGTEQPYAYFPTHSIISLLHVMEDRASTEIGMVGNEGLVGIALFMGGNTTPGRAVVQSAGEAFRMKAKFIRDEFFLAGPVQKLFLRYTQALMTQMTQTAACNRHHNIEQQLSRRLLMSLDRSPTEVLPMTHELIAHLMGVRRGGITVAASKLQQEGMIEYSRGRIRVLDRRRLERSACECYRVVKAEFARLLPQRGVRAQRKAPGSSTSVNRQ